MEQKTVQELEGIYGKEPELFIGEMQCHICKSWCAVREDVYLKRLIHGKEKGMGEVEVNATYVCRECRAGKSVKKDEYVKKVEEMRNKMAQAAQKVSEKKASK